MLDIVYGLGVGSLAIDKGIPTYQHSYSYDGSGGGSAQNYTEYAVNLTSGQYSGSAPDLGWKESGLIGNTPVPTRTLTPVRTPTQSSFTPTQSINTPTPHGNVCTYFKN